KRSAGARRREGCGSTNANGGRTRLRSRCFAPSSRRRKWQASWRPSTRGREKCAMRISARRCLAAERLTRQQANRRRSAATPQTEHERGTTSRGRLTGRDGRSKFLEPAPLRGGPVGQVRGGGAQPEQVLRGAP